MLIRDVCSIALYCQHCGSIHIHDVPYFPTSCRTVLRCGNCGHEKARLLRPDPGRLFLDVACVVCGRENRFSYGISRLRRLSLEKIYCGKEHFELGYIGRRGRIRELMAFNQAEFEALHPGDGKNIIDKQRILLEALNLIHDMARSGDIACPCGSDQLAVDICGSFIVIGCEHCGSSRILRAENAGDLRRLRFGVGLRTPSRA